MVRRRLFEHMGPAPRYRRLSRGVDAVIACRSDGTCGLTGGSNTSGAAGVTHAGVRYGRDRFPTHTYHSFWM